LLIKAAQITRRNVLGLVGMKAASLGPVKNGGTVGSTAGDASAIPVKGRWFLALALLNQKHKSAGNSLDNTWQRRLDVETKNCHLEIFNLQRSAECP